MMTCSTLKMIRVIEIKSKIRYQFTAVRMGFIIMSTTHTYKKPQFQKIDAPQCPHNQDMEAA